MALTQRAALGIVTQHFQLFINTPIIDRRIGFSLTSVQKVTPRNRGSLVREFVEHLTFVRYTRSGKIAKLEKIRVTPANRAKAVRQALPIFRNALYLVGVRVTYRKSTHQVFTVVRRGAKPLDFATVVDPIVPSLLPTPATIEFKGSQNKIYTFSSAAGLSCQFIVTVSATCGASGLRACDGDVTFNNGSGCFLYHGSTDWEVPIAKTPQGCCELNYYIDLEYGLTATSVSWSGHGFTVTGGSLSETIYSKGGQLSDCCPERTPASTQPRPSHSSTSPKPRPSDSSSGSAFGALESSELGSCYSNAACGGSPVATNVTVAECLFEHDGKSWKSNKTGDCKRIAQ
jgi:hypothetical protein